MADVYLAVAAGPSGFTKQLVVKELRPPLVEDPAFLSMFLNEARLAARLDHPNVVQTYEVGQIDGRVFIAMEYLEGQPLNRLLARARTSNALPLEARLVILCELLDGLHYAHTLTDYSGKHLGIVHRDMSPHNAFITYDGRIKVVDFGIAKGRDSVSETRVGVLKGKIGYMAPEQARGESVDARADIFSVGAILWEMVTGQRLWAGSAEPATLALLVAGDVPPVSSVRPDLPPELGAITDRACSANREERFPSAAAFRDALLYYLESLGLRCSPREIGAIVATLFARERSELLRVAGARLSALELGAERTPGRGATTPLPDCYSHPCTLNSRSAAFRDGSAGGTTRSGRSLLRDWLGDAGPPTRSDLPAGVPMSLREQAPPNPRAWRRWTALAGIAVLVLGGVAVGRYGIPSARRDVSATSRGKSGSTQPAGAAAVPVFGASEQRCGGVQRPLVELTGDIDKDATLRCNRDYLLRFTAFVLPGTTLTIEPGTRILGDPATKGTLVVRPGARLVAAGSAGEPIVFTSNAPEGERRAGDWGGLLILGRAPINLRDANGAPGRGTVEGIAAHAEYGGNEPEDDSGTLEYVRIEYSGTEIAPNNEINGLTLAGVGRGTRIDHVQVRHTADDCFEFFGGTVDAKHLACEWPGDDGIDWDYGYTGRIQYALVVFEPGVGVNGSGIEADNDPDGSANRPISAPTLSNVTLCGTGRAELEHYGIVVRRGTRGTLRDFVVSGFAAGLDVRGANTRVILQGGSFHGNRPENLAYLERRGAPIGPYEDDDNGLNEQAWLGEDRQSVTESDPHIDCAEGIYAPAAPLVDGAQTLPRDGFTDVNARYLGAFRDRTDTWHHGWTVWSHPRVGSSGIGGSGHR